MKLTYLLNSGFAAELGDTLLVFDDYRDPAGAVRAALPAVREVYFFASHAHFDHFDAHILDYAPQTNRYFFSEEIRPLQSAGGFPEGKVTYLNTYDSYADEGIKVTSFDSTDTGTSFLIEKDGIRIFHAGDFNWWHWKGDTEQNIKFARNGFMKQMKKLDGLEADLAFFPVDGRLGEFWDIGAREFCARTNVRALVTMHNVGYPVWKPAVDFFLPGKELPYWSPEKPGESRIFKIGGEFKQ